MPKKFFYFLFIIQLILTFGHWLLYGALIFFFPWLAPIKTVLLVTLFVLSISFITLSIATFKKENAILKIAYIISSLWTVSWFYLLLAAATSSVLVLAIDNSLAPFTFGIATLFSMYGIINARIIRTTSITVKLPNLPEYWKGKTAAMVSDLHLGHVLKKGFAKKVINKINSLNPEVVFIPGDFFDGVKTNFQELADLFKQIKAPSGVYFCSGNHELFAGMGACEKAIRQSGMRVLENELINIHGIQVAGVAYKYERMPDLTQTLTSLNINKSQPTILLKHVPLQLQEAADAGVSLHLSGHTHVGQVWPGPLITERYYKGYDYGLKQYEGMAVFVSSGVGTWGPPMRTCTKSEIVKIIFE